MIDDSPDKEEKLPAPDEPPALDPPEASRASSTRVETQRSTPPLIRWIAGAVIVLILALLILLLARWIYHKSHHSIQPPAGANKQSAQSSNKSTQSGQSQQSTGSSGTSSNTGNNNTSNNAATTLPNNGPGNVAGLFVISTGAAAGLHYLVRSRRVNN